METMVTEATVQRSEATVIADFRTPRGRSARMHVREGTNDWNTLTACMTEDEYGLRDLPNLAGWAIDVGGYLGGVAVGLALDHPALRVLVVEPVPANVDLIEANAQLNGVGDRVAILTGAVGDGSPVDVWYGYSGDASAEHHRFVGNSTIAYDHGGELPHATASYPTSYTLKALIAGIGADRVALLKIDCEGGEWPFLADSTVALCERIVGEAHAVRGHRGADVLPLLEPTHEVTIQGDPDATCEFRAVAR